MDHPDSPGGGRSSRKELQGPRPTPLKVRKDSHKIRKPPVAPPMMGGATQNPQPHQPQPPRQPVIIYTVSPKVIHTHPSEFMTLVQRLTGPDHATSSSSSSSYSSSQYHPSFSTTTSSSSFINDFPSYDTTHNMAHHISGGISPAARFASIEKTKMHSEVKNKYVGPSEVRQGVKESVNNMNLEHGTGGGGGGGGGGGNDEGGVERTVFFPGILSPGPGSLPPISPNLFSPLFHHDPNHTLNVQPSNRSSLMEGSYLPSPFPTNLFTPSPMFSPSSLDFLQRVWDS